MSGGVDSSVAAYMLKEHGADIEGVFMYNWDTRDESGNCPSEKDWRDVQNVCSQLEIKCHKINLVKQYWNQVFSIVLDEYAQGRTPNPDILCNSQIKFGVLLDEIQRRLNTSNAWFATGHYAQIKRNETNITLHRGIDVSKDQSYFLSTLNNNQLKRVVFPLGGLYKSNVRILAKHLRLITAEKDESMGICFVGERKRFDKFLAEYLPQNPGNILSNNMHLIGKHNGLFTKTIGQLAGISGASEKWYIYAKDLKTNSMYAVKGRNHALLHTKYAVAGPVHWISGAPLGFNLNSEITLQVKIRYLQEPLSCIVRQTTNKDNINVEFSEAQYAVASGQYLVFYQGDCCLGSAQVYTPQDTG
ncbi:tRNA-specific 2-thiouridylase MnmA [Coemansia reversa NRRL 1564]|uniref:tRNA-5-taurinomethyluridine 2-sulfurtransferase n=1 Tax=Coemansia reversa (strain ATCC 12441 / NRRL 1564) TaxID=763665 RepID=A0A2G5BB54_COERN|nr:tRNA-specific 2-thiouridylase MnmA [Coemansia reversa NRRL 1564]|eukprot:PIA16222.1 tRNA-specific 2-thiouridylase MnmA [Coemansia reversa NRRL 1564]